MGSMADGPSLAADGKPDLKKGLGVFELTGTGVGIIVGTGTFVLVGKGAGMAGGAIWVPFLAGHSLNLASSLSK